MSVDGAPNEPWWPDHIDSPSETPGSGATGEEWWKNHPELQSATSLATNQADQWWHDASTTEANPPAPTEAPDDGVNKTRLDPEFAERSRRVLSKFLGGSHEDRLLTGAPVAVTEDEAGKTDPELLKRLQLQIESGEISSFQLFDQSEQDREGWRAMIDSLGESGTMDVMMTASPHFLVITTKPLENQAA